MTDPALAGWLASLPAPWRRDGDLDVVGRARAAYDSPGRHYHTWEHAVACVETLRLVDVARPRPAFLALVFHDAVYVPGRADNEERSARLAADALAAAADLTDADRASVGRAIRATRDHHALGAALPEDERAVLDADLAVLGAPWDAYARYARDVEQEYVPAVTSAAGFRAGRAEFLERLLARARLYLTDAAEARWGAAARANAARELAALRGSGRSRR